MMQKNFKKMGSKLLLGATTLAMAVPGTVLMGTTPVFAGQLPRLNLNEGVRLESSGEQERYTFTPDTDGYYELYSYDIETGDPIAGLYEDETFESMLKEDDDNEERGGRNFSLISYLEAGVTYYYQIRDYGDMEFAYSVKMVPYVDPDTIFDWEKSENQDWIHEDLSLALDEELKISGKKNEPVVIWFTAQKNGIYGITSFDEDGCDPRGALCSYEPATGIFTTLADNDDDDSVSGSVNFYMEAELKAGETYAIIAGEYNHNAYDYSILISESKGCREVDVRCVDENGNDLSVPYTITVRNGMKREYTAPWQGVAYQAVEASRIIDDTTNEVVFVYRYEPVNINLQQIRLGNTSVNYTGKSITPEVSVYTDDADERLQEGVDYTVKYTNNKNAGTASVTITGKGDYTGTVTRSFKINKIANTISKVTAKKNIKLKNLKKKNQSFQITANVKGKAKTTFTRSSVTKKAKSYITVSKSGKVTVKKGLKKGTYTLKVKITSAATANYKKTSAIKTIKIVVK